MAPSVSISGFDDAVCADEDVVTSNVKPEFPDAPDWLILLSLYTADNLLLTIQANISYVPYPVKSEERTSSKVVAVCEHNFSLSNLGNYPSI